MPESDLLALINRDMDRATAEMRAVLAKEMFRTDPFLAALPVRPWPWYKRAAFRVRWYLVNLWTAICGRTPDCDCSDY